MADHGRVLRIGQHEEAKVVRSAAELLDVTTPGWWMENPDHYLDSADVRLRKYWAREIKERAIKGVQEARQKMGDERTSRAEIEAEMDELADVMEAPLDGETNRRRG